jgi:hypothetical protein
MGNLGGASFKVAADASAFMEGMNMAKQAADRSAKAIQASVTQASKAIDTYALAMTKAEMASEIAAERATRNAVAQTRMRQALDEDAAALRRQAAAQIQANVAALQAEVAQNRLRQAAQGAGGAAAAAGQSGRMGAMGFLYLSQAVEDAQYGFSAIVNNIPMLVMSLGGSSGVAGAVSIAAVAINLLINHWRDMISIMQSAWSGKPLDDIVRIREEASKAADEFDRMSKSKTNAQEVKEAGIAESFKQGPVGAIFEKLVSAISADPGLRAERQQLEPSLRRVSTPEEAAELQRKFDEQAMAKDRATAAKLMGSYATDKNSQATVKRLLGPDDPVTRAEERRRNEHTQEMHLRRQELTPEQERNKGIQEAYQQRITDAGLSERDRNKATQEAYMQRQQAAQDAKVKTAAQQMMQSPLGQMMLSGGVTTDPNGNIRGRLWSAQHRPMFSQTRGIDQEAEIKKRLRATGGNVGDAAEIRAEMAKLTDQAIRDRQAEKGITRERAKQELMLENVQRNNPDFGKKRQEPSAFFGLAEFAKHIQVGALDIPKKQLTAAQETNRLLALLVGRGNVAPAVAGGPP